MDKALNTTVHLVGSLGLRTTEEAFLAPSNILGALAPRLSDGEIGERSHWIMWQRKTFERSSDLEAADTFSKSHEQGYVNAQFRLRPGRKANDIIIPPLGYAEVARQSYKIFAQLKREGKIGKDVRFMVALPTAVALLWAFVTPAEHQLLNARIEARIIQEVLEVVAAVPAEELTIQWDVAIEFPILEGVRSLRLPEPEQDMLEALVRLGNAPPSNVELGFHFCYGDSGHKHAVEPTSLDRMVQVANHLSKGISRTINFVHMPVPRDRSDDAYFQPATRLTLAPETEFILGLVHYTDGVEGSMRRAKTAKNFVQNFNIATECGFGRREEGTILDLLRIHREVAERLGLPG